MATSTNHIAVSSSNRKYRIDNRKIATMAHSILDSLGIAEFQLSVQFVDVATMKKLNKTYRNIDKSTDVLSFPQYEWNPPLRTDQKLTKIEKKKTFGTDLPLILGDVVISLADASKNAKKIGHDLDEETAFLLVHGILHLCGHDHEIHAEEKIMTAQQKILMSTLGKTLKAAKPSWYNCVAADSKIPK